jgi:3-hydroxyacyl-CoA dehydrogenase
MTNIAIIGTGLIGKAWSVVFADAGFDVTLWDASPGAAETAIAFVREQHAEMALRGLVASDTEATLGRIALAPTLAAAVRGAYYVQENGPERLEVRRELFLALDRHAPPDAVLASSTSAMPASAFASDLPGRHRCIVAHPTNPPHLVPLVEIAPAPFTDAATVKRTREILLRAGRKPALLQKEVDGFVLNRLQGALLAEAFRLVEDGVMSPDDIDTVIKHGLGLRWAFMGPFETIDLNAPAGVADYCARYGGFYALLQQQMQPRSWSPALVAQVEAMRRAQLPEDGLAARQVWRDRRLMALAAHKASQPEV